MAEVHKGGFITRPIFYNFTLSQTQPRLARSAACQAVI
jgi:hypothetical protein